MITYKDLNLKDYSDPIQKWISKNITLMDSLLSIHNNRDMLHWLPVYNEISGNSATLPILEDGYLCNSKTFNFPMLKDQLMAFHPWRKGPFKVDGITIETEWRSDYKWNRLQPFLPSLKNTDILDIGSGNGYHCFRMALDGARSVIGIDPFILNVLQFHVLKKFFQMDNITVLPLGIEDIPLNMQVFNLVFSMGVLYHRKSPFDHLIHIKSLLKTGGTAVIETLIIEGPEGMTLVPQDRYAKMRNVWFLPTPETMLQWMKRCGFRNPRCVDITKTTLAEQRPTEWMTFESLPEFIDNEDSTKTIEGYPAPLRGIFIGEV